MYGIVEVSGLCLRSVENQSIPIISAENRLTGLRWKHWICGRLQGDVGKSKSLVECLIFPSASKTRNGELMVKAIWNVLRNSINPHNFIVWAILLQHRTARKTAPIFSR